MVSFHTVLRCFLIYGIFLNKSELEALEVKRLPPPLDVTHLAKFTIEIQKGSTPEHIGTITIGLFGNVVPKTVAEFLKHVESTNAGETYSGRTFHRVIPHFIIQGGDLVTNNGSSGYKFQWDPHSENLYHFMKFDLFSDPNNWFPSENYELNHYGAGWVGIANVRQKDGKDTNGPQFYITLNPTPWLDGNSVVFGKIIQGMNITRRIEEVDLMEDGETPKNRVILIKDCSAETLTEPFPKEKKEAVKEYV